MKVSAISFTRRGLNLSKRLAQAWEGERISLFTKCASCREEVVPVRYAGQGAEECAGEQKEEEAVPVRYAGQSAEECAGEQKEEGAIPVQYMEQSVEEWAGEQMEEGNALVFIGACGIAVRSIAPHLTDKLHDSPVIVLDEKGKHAIPILSGHFGGANRLAEQIAKVLGAEAVITTATDLNGKFAVDAFARENGLAAAPKEGIAKVSAKVLEGEEITISIEPGLLPEGAVFPEGVRPVPYPPDRRVDVLASFAGARMGKGKDAAGAALFLFPREYAIGVGCKRGKSAEEIEAFLQKALERAGICAEQVFTLASLDRKKDEPGLRSWCRKHKIPFSVYGAGQLQELEGNFQPSAFVLEETGVDNVCERAAAMACAPGGTVVFPKCAGNGITAAIAKRPWDVSAAGNAAERDARPETRASEGSVNQERYAPAKNARPEMSAAEGSVNQERRAMERDARPEMSAAKESEKKSVQIDIVGIGPGKESGMTVEAIRALEEADVIIGYPAYLRLLGERFSGKEFLSSPMRREEERCRMCFREAARGKKAALVCSGDAGIYGLASLMHEIGKEYPQIGLRVVPGVTAASSGAAVLGAPVNHDFCAVSLSDYLTPWETIERRLEAAAKSGFAIVLYNPASRTRPGSLARACGVLLKYMEAERPCGYVANIGRDGERSVVCTLGELRDARADMFTTVFIGNEATENIGGKLVAKRGYQIGKNTDICRDDGRT